MLTVQLARDLSLAPGFFMLLLVTPIPSARSAMAMKLKRELRRNMSYTCRCAKRPSKPLSDMPGQRAACAMLGSVLRDDPHRINRARYCSCMAVCCGPYSGDFDARARARSR
jgi:hypothetical protein